MITIITVTEIMPIAHTNSNARLSLARVPHKPGEERNINRGKNRKHNFVPANGLLDLLFFRHGTDSMPLLLYRQ